MDNQTDGLTNWQTFLQKNEKMILILGFTVLIKEEETQTQETFLKAASSCAEERSLNAAMTASKGMKL